MSDLREDGILSQYERASLCEGKTPIELRDLLFNGKVTINDVRRALAFAPINDGDVFYEKPRVVPTAEESAA